MINKHKFVGRESEMARLRGLLSKQSASLVVVRGRRRIGKSRLLSEFGKEVRSFFFSGNPPDRTTTAQSQREVFTRQMRLSGLRTPQLNTNWGDIFWTLAKSLDEGPVLIVLDEISWMGGKDKEFLGELKTAWDLYFSKNPQLIMVLCGSISSWIEKNILSSTGFVGRIVIDLVLRELPLQACNAFWEPKANRVTPYEKFKMLAITGGVPLYLEQIKPNLSAEENIKELCFKQGGLLVREFEEIFADLFSRSKARHKQIVRRLAEGACELSDILQTLGKGQGGTYSKQLDELIKAGFVKRDFSWSFQTGKQGKVSRFRLSDNYLRFYLKYIMPNLTKIEERFFEEVSVANLPAWDTILGLQFENLVANNAKRLWEALGIPPEAIVAEGPFFQRKTKLQQGCQIDYLIQTRFNTLYLCEIKFSRKRIDSRVVDSIQQKIDRLSHPASFSIRPVLIHVNGVEDSVMRSGYFDQIIDFSDMLGTPRKEVNMKALEDAYRKSLASGSNKSLEEVAAELGIDLHLM